jgi:cytochrome c-type biogenesis protein CcmH
MSARLLLLLGLCLACVSVARAVDNTPPLPDPVQQQRYLNLTHELRCMQCQNESLADSPVGLAADLRRDVREQIVAGRTDDQIRDRMVGRYGEFILFRPRMNLRNAWLWAAPLVFMVIGVLIAVRVLRARAAQLGPDEDSPDVSSSES